MGGRYSDEGVLGGAALQLSMLALRFDDGSKVRAYDPKLLVPNERPNMDRYIEVCASASVDDVNVFLASRQRALPMTGAHSGQTFIGAVSTSTHGTGFPPLVDFVRSIELVVARPNGNAEVWRVERPHGISGAAALQQRGVLLRGVTLEEEHWFDAIGVSVGAMGVITSVAIEARAAFLLVGHTRGVTWAELRDLELPGPPPHQPAALRLFAPHQPVHERRARLSGLHRDRAPRDRDGLHQRPAR